jgi:hypothetical protein
MVIGWSSARSDVQRPFPLGASIIDAGGDDYIADLKRSVFVDPTVADPDAPPGWLVMVDLTGGQSGDLSTVRSVICAPQC